MCKIIVYCISFLFLNLILDIKFVQTFILLLVTTDSPNLILGLDRPLIKQTVSNRHLSSKKCHEVRQIIKRWSRSSTIKLSMLNFFLQQMKAILLTLCSEHIIDSLNFKLLVLFQAVSKANTKITGKIQLNCCSFTYLTEPSFIKFTRLFREGECLLISFCISSSNEL